MEYLVEREEKYNYDITIMTNFFNQRNELKEFCFII